MQQSSDFRTIAYDPDQTGEQPGLEMFDEQKDRLDAVLRLSSDLKTDGRDPLSDRERCIHLVDHRYFEVTVNLVADSWRNNDFAAAVSTEPDIEHLQNIHHYCNQRQQDYPVEHEDNRTVSHLVEMEILAEGRSMELWDRCGYWKLHSFGPY